MKGIFIEREGRNAVVMDNKGRFMKVRAGKGWNRGDEVNFPSPAARTAKSFSIAAMLVVVLALGVFGLYTVNAYTVNLDVNPSIEIEVNAFNNVTAITALNDDAQEIGDLQSLVGMKLGPAVNSAILMLLDEGYLEEDGTVVLSIDGKNKVRTVVREVSEAVEDAVVEDETDEDEEDIDADSGMKIYVGRITEEMAEISEELGIPVGRIVLAEKAIEEGATFDYESTVYLSVQEIQSIRNISKTINKATDLFNEEGNPNQFEAMSRKILRDASKIEKEIAEIEALIAKGEAGDDTVLRYEVLFGQFNEILSSIDAIGVQADLETDEIINGMAQMKGADKEEKEQIREEIKIAKEAEQDAEHEEIGNRVEEKLAEVKDKVQMLQSAKGKAEEDQESENPGEGNPGSEKGKDNGNNSDDKNNGQSGKDSGNSQGKGGN